MTPKFGCSFSNCENEEPTYCTVSTEKKSRPLPIGWVKPTLATPWNLGAVGSRFPSERPPTGRPVFGSRTVDSSLVSLQVAEMP